MPRRQAHAVLIEVLVARSIRSPRNRDSIPLAGQLKQVALLLHRHGSWVCSRSRLASISSLAVMRVAVAVIAFTAMYAG